MTNPQNEQPRSWSEVLRRNAELRQPLVFSYEGASRNQGTESVCGTWHSQGEAGRHPQFSAGSSGPNSLAKAADSESLPVQHRLDRIAEQAQQYPEMAFTTLAHHVDVAMLEQAFHSLNRKSAAGVDRVTWRAYERHLRTNLEKLHEKLIQRRYEPQPVKRRWIRKSSGKLRPLGLPALEDKIVSKAVQTLLEQIYERDFCDFSYGFRPGRSCHYALHDLRQGMLNNNVRYVLDCDISSFFDDLQHDQLLAILKKRVKDGRVLKWIKMWLKAGIMDGKDLVFPEKGSPQGSVISPLLANLYLHEVLDTWFQEVVTAHSRGKVMLIRYADDFIIGCENKEDAERIMKVLPLRFAKYGLTINSEKTHMAHFERPPRTPHPKHRGPKPPTFAFLGFVHYWGRTQRGGYTIKRKTQGKRLASTLSSLWQWCRDNRHRPLESQQAILCAKLRGYYQYYGVRCNYDCLDVVHRHVMRSWHYWLNRRGGRQLTWQTYARLLETFPLPPPRIVQSWV